MVPKNHFESSVPWECCLTSFYFVLSVASNARRHNVHMFSMCRFRCRIVSSHCVALHRQNKKRQKQRIGKHTHTPSTVATANAVFSFLAAIKMESERARQRKKDVDKSRFTRSESILQIMIIMLIAATFFPLQRTEKKLYYKFSSLLFSTLKTWQMYMRYTHRKYKENREFLDQA